MRSVLMLICFLLRFSCFLALSRRVFAMHFAVSSLLSQKPISVVVGRVVLGAFLCVNVWSNTATAAKNDKTAPATAPTAKSKRYISVLEFSGQVLTRDIRLLLSDTVRQEAVRLFRGNLDVMTRENQDTLLRAFDVDTSQCGVDGCEVDLLRTIQARYGVTGSITRVGKSYIATLKVYDVENGSVLQIETAKANNEEALIDAVGKSAKVLLQGALPDLVVKTGTSAGTQNNSQNNAQNNSQNSTTNPNGTNGTVKNTNPNSTPSEDDIINRRIQEKFDDEKITVCTSPSKQSVWWFCDSNQAYTENEFVRRYRALTYLHDLDAAEQTRTGTYVAYGLLGTGLVSAGLGVLALATQSDYAVLGGFGVVYGGLAAYYGAALLFLPADGSVDSWGADGAATEHILSEGQGRAAIERYNQYLLQKIQRELAVP